MFTKIKKGSGTSFELFFHKNVPYVILINGQSFSLPFFLRKISNKICYYVLIYTVDAIINFKICVGSSSKWLIGRKLGEDENIKFEYLRNEESFLDEIKNIFHNF